MKKQDFYDFLDKSPTGEADSDLVHLLKEVEQLDTPDPGQEYWNNFNSRLQQKLEVPEKRSIWRWFGAPIWGSLAAAAVMVFVFWPKGTEVDVVPSIEDMNAQELALLADVYVPFEEEVSYDLNDADADLLLENYSFGDDPGLLDTDFDAETFKSLWQTEG